jgi:NodT family efflux transporter outer membrane factor (OMF) lipoprotein
MAALAGGLFAGCAGWSGAPQTTPSAAAVADQWLAPLPHEGQVHALSQWWQQLDDPVLLALVQAAQAASPTLASAASRIEAARAALVASGAALTPQVNATASASRGVAQPNVPVATSQSLGLQAAWELDWLGANSQLQQANQANVQGQQALWHDARVSVAAEVANTYYSLAACQSVRALRQAEVQSRQTSERLTQQSAQAGFSAQSDAALARASTADAHSRLARQTADCDVYTKALVALSAWPEAVLRDQLATVQPRDALAPALRVTTVPAQTLAQRPDVFAAERNVLLARAQWDHSQALRYPRLTLAGSLGRLRYSSEGQTSDLNTWSFGPLALTLPLLDGGQAQANVLAAQARYQEAWSLYQAKVRQAVREVEEALVNLHSAQTQRAQAEKSVDNYNQWLAATQARYDHGMASLLELEQARLAQLNAQTNQWQLQGERNRAWVALYRALGGGWQAPQDDAAMPSLSEASSPSSTASPSPASTASETPSETPSSTAASIPASSPPSNSPATSSANPSPHPSTAAPTL